MTNLSREIAFQKINSFIRSGVISLHNSPEIDDPEKFKLLSFESLNFDSLAYMEFCIAIFCSFGRELSIEKCQELGNIAAIVNYLCDHECAN